MLKSRKKRHAEEKPYPRWVLAVVGFFAGFVSGITGAIGLLFNRFYLKYGLTKEEIVATRAANEVSLHVIKLAMYIALGLYSQTASWLGLTIAVGAVLSAYTVKFILPHLSDFVFRKIGYGAMVLSGVVLLGSTSAQIIRQDHISVSENALNETTMKWRKSSFVLEFAIDDGLEVERPIQPNELPYTLRVKYDSLRGTYDTIELEKVFKIGEHPAYEFYCYKNHELTKLDFE